MVRSTTSEARKNQMDNMIQIKEIAAEAKASLQHFVTLCEKLRKAGIETEIEERRIGVMGESARLDIYVKFTTSI
jgi:DNA-binding IscR family transcriptional regulator